MAVAHTEYQVTFSAASSVSVTAGSSQTSDIEAFATTAIDAMITFKADNASTPAAGDVVDCYVLYSTGDPDGASTDEFDTTTQGTFMCSLDTNSDDPAIKTVPLRTAASEFKVYFVSNAASNSITCSAGWTEVTA